MTSQHKGTGRRRDTTSNNLPDLPRATEAERVVIGAVLLNPASNQHVLSKLSPEFFYNKQLAVVFSRLCIMKNRGKTLDLTSLIDELDSHNELEPAGGAPLVASHTDGIHGGLQLDSYVKEIRSKAVLRRLAHLGVEIKELALKAPTAREALIAAEKRIAELRGLQRSQEITNTSDSLPEILNEIAVMLGRFVAMSPAQRDIVTLWIVHTHAFEASDVTGYLSITSAEKRCGKTRLLEMLEQLVAEPWMTGRPTVAVFVRKIAAMQPTLLLDESDTALTEDSEYSETLRGVLNLGYKRGGKTSMCVGEASSMTFMDFSVFCPKAIAGIGTLPDTVADRSFPIRLKRRAGNEKVERFQRVDVEKEAEPLRGQIASVAAKVFDSLKSSKPAFMDALGDRENEIASPLLAIADLAGADWFDRARAALLEIFIGSEVPKQESVSTRLLTDISRVFLESRLDRIPTQDLREKLCADGESPWSEFAHGKPISDRTLARLLSKYAIKSEHWRDGSKTFRGYRASAFRDAWSRYCAPTALGTDTSGTTGTDSIFNDLAVPDKSSVSDTSGTDETPGTAKSFKTDAVPLVPVVPVPEEPTDE